MRLFVTLVLAATLVRVLAVQGAAAPGVPSIPKPISIGPDEGYLPETGGTDKKARPKGPTEAQVKTVLTLGPTAELLVDAGGKVRFADLLETSLVSWATAKAKEGKCAYDVRAIPVRPDGLQWDGTPKTLAGTELPGTDCAGQAPPALVRSSADRIWVGLGDGPALRVTAFEADGTALGLQVTPSPVAAPARLFVLSGMLVVQGGKSAVGLHLDARPELIAIPGITREVVVSHPDGWLGTDDGTLLRLDDPQLAPSKKSYRLPVKPAERAPVLMASTLNGYVIAGCTGNQLGVWFMDDRSAKIRPLFRKNGLGCPGALRVTFDRKILVASLMTGKSGPESASVTLLAPTGKPLGPSLQVRLSSADEPALGLTQAGDWATLLWASPEGTDAVVRGADISLTEAGPVWMASTAP